MPRIPLLTALLRQALPGRLGRLRRHFGAIARGLRAEVARAVGRAVAGTVRDAVGGLLGAEPGEVDPPPRLRPPAGQQVRRPRPSEDDPLAAPDFWSR